MEKLCHRQTRKRFTNGGLPAQFYRERTTGRCPKCNTWLIFQPPVEITLTRGSPSACLPDSVIGFNLRTLARPAVVTPLTWGSTAIAADGYSTLDEKLGEMRGHTFSDFSLALRGPVARKSEFPQASIWLGSHRLNRIRLRRRLYRPPGLVCIRAARSGLTMGASLPAITRPQAGRPLVSADLFKRAWCTPGTVDAGFAWVPVAHRLTADSATSKDTWFRGTLTSATLLAASAPRGSSCILRT